MSDVTLILQRIESGDREATNELLPLVYDELRRLANSKIGKESPGQDLQATGLVHEAYLRLVNVAQKDEAAGGSKNSAKTEWANRSHFFSAASEAMRRILIDQARSRKSLKRGAGAKPISLDSVEPIANERAEELVQLDEALSELEILDPQKAELVKLKFFVGVTTPQAAEILGIPLRTAERTWAFARAWLYREMSEKADETTDS